MVIDFLFQSGDHGLPPPGDNLPFAINNRYKLTLYFVLFFGSGLTVPFYAMRHQLLKK
jgi:cytochrome c oxidase subunit 7c